MNQHSRLLSLDVFRGATMAAMVIVNNPGDWAHVYPPLLHAEWHGWTPTDLIFPFFLFIVGVSMVLSTTIGAPWPRIVRRALVLVALGLLLAGFPRYDVRTLRFPGVLQRIGLCYLAAATVVRLTRDASADWRRHALRVGAATGALVVVYWILMTRVAPPGGVAGDLSPDGNLAAWIDRQLMTGHLWRPTWDPEGLLSTVPAIATTLLGVLAGLMLRRGANAATLPRETGRAVQLFAIGFGLALLGLAWDRTFPINKNLWTSSYVLFTGGLAAMLLASAYWVVDVRGARGWTKPFEILGLNAIVLFVLSGVIARLLGIIRIPAAGDRVALKAFLYDGLFVQAASPPNASLLWAIANLALLFLILALMYWRRLFVKV